MGRPCFNFSVLSIFRWTHLRLQYWLPTTRARIIDAARDSACPRKTARITVVNAKLDGEANIATPVSVVHVHIRIRLRIGLLTFCNLPTAPTCRKEQYRDYYMEHGCRSTKPVRNSVCSGNCGSDCCRPRRSKKRRLKLICNDGTRYTKEIEIVRKCGCSRKCL